MIFFLRDKDTDETIADIEYYINDIDGYKFLELKPIIMLQPYSYKLLEIKDKTEKNEFIYLMDFVSELRGWLNETYFQGRQNTIEEYDDVLEAIRKILKNVAQRTDTYLVED